MFWSSPPGARNLGEKMSRRFFTQTKRSECIEKHFFTVFPDVFPNVFPDVFPDAFFRIRFSGYVFPDTFFRIRFSGRFSASFSGCFSGRFSGRIFPVIFSETLYRRLLSGRHGQVFPKRYTKGFERHSGSWAFSSRALCEIISQSGQCLAISSTIRSRSQLEGFVFFCLPVWPAHPSLQVLHGVSSDRHAAPKFTSSARV